MSQSGGYRSPAEFLQAEQSRTPKRVVASFLSLRILPLLRGAPEIPLGICHTVAEGLQSLVAQRTIRGALVHRFGADLLVQANLVGADPYQTSPETNVWTSIVQSLKQCGGSTGGPYPDLNEALSSPEPELTQRFHVRTLWFPFSERGAEPLFIAKLIGGALGGFNRALFNLFFHPDKGSHQRLDGTRFIALVEHIPTLLEGRTKRRIYFFGDRPAEEILHLLYPFAKHPVTVRRDQVADWAEGLSLVANPAEWAIAAIFAVAGRFVHDGQSWLATRHEPVALVAVDPAGANPCSEPWVVLRLQSGLPAVGEAHFNLGGDFHLTVGGDRGGYHLALAPVSLEEAAQGRLEPGTARIAAYSYQSYDTGAIPPPHDVVDVFAQDPVQTRWLQRRAYRYAQLLLGHGEFQPFVTAEEAERRARQQVAELTSYFHPIPAVEQGQKDTMVERAVPPGSLVVSDIKADGGGKLGHTAPPTLFASVARASLEEAKNEGAIFDFEVFAVGDDLHLLMLHDRGADANAIHLLAFRTFWRAVWVTQLLQYKPYGLAQDLKIGPATKGWTVEDLAEPSATFVELIARYLPSPENRALPKIRQAREAWASGRGQTAVQKPFAGNVTGQGPGFAELPIIGTASMVGLVAADKAGPAAFNLPIWQAVRSALVDPEYRRKYGQSIAVEIFDVHEHRRIFLDAVAHETEIVRLLSATNLFNVKHLWSLPTVVEDLSRVAASLDRIILAASTEKLAIIAGGEYVGKDDPVLLGVLELVEPIYRFMRDGFYLTQGDERGSHYMMLSPKPLREAIATVRSRGLEVGLRIGISPGKRLQIDDVYDQPGYLEARERIEALNHELWLAQGSEFTPIGVGARDVEPAYPLMKVLERLTGEKSPYAVTIGEEARPPAKG